MAKNPKSKPSGIFDQKIDGVLGAFATTESYKVQYLLASLKLPRANSCLEIASEAFPFSTIDFEEMVQRDVDYNRVNRIVNDYLLKGSGRVLFFPPLIVAVVATEQGTPINLYSKVESKRPDGTDELNYTFDGDKFQLQLTVSDEPTGYEMEHENKLIPVYQYAATLAWTSNLVKLVVIDGQHRFEALRSLYKMHEDLSEPIEVPVCLVYTPDAIEGQESEEILKDLREMFVRINTTAKQVSGHFIELLRDQSLSSITAREFANSWKNSDAIAWKSKLHLLEWNERSDNKASIVQRDYAVTTISIIADVLREHLYSSKARNKAVPQELLRLSLAQDELERDPEAPRFHQIDDENFSHTQEDILRKQIVAYIVPALDALFTEPKFYKETWNKLQEAINEISKKADNNVTGYRYFRQEILGHFRKWEEHKDGPAARDAQDEFDSIVKTLDVAGPLIFYNVFQQGYIRLWLEFTQQLAPLAEIDPVDCAKTVVKICEAYLFPNCVKLFQRDQIYANRVLYSGLKPNVTGWGKTAWSNLFKVSLLNPKSISTLNGELEGTFNLSNDKKLSVMAEAKNIGHKALDGYLEELNYRVSMDIEANWRTKGYDRGLTQELEKLLEKDDKEQFDEKLTKLKQEEFSEAKNLLGNILKITIK